MHDVVIVGGSYSGMAAAMPLARARRDVLVLDSGLRRNRFASESHNFLGQDGEDPAAIAAKGKREILAYSTVTWRDEEAIGASAVEGGFAVVTKTGEHRGKRLVLATGVVDELPEVPGLRERWGRTVFHCPYCHGYELHRGKLGVLATAEHSFVQAALVADWAARGDTTVFVDPRLGHLAEQLADLDRRGIQVERAPVVAVEGDEHRAIVRVSGDRTFELAGLFVTTRMRIAGPFAEQLGCEVDTHPNGNFYKTDATTKETTTRGVFACGDAATPMTTLPFAVADGFRAGIGAHRSLVF